MLTVPKSGPAWRLFFLHAPGDPRRLILESTILLMINDFGLVKSSYFLPTLSAISTGSSSRASESAPVLVSLKAPARTVVGSVVPEPFQAEEAT